MKALLSPKEVALAIGVSESSLKRWADEGLIAVSRTAGGHRRIALPEAIRFVRQQKATVLRPDILGLPEVAAVTAGQDRSPGIEADLFQSLQSGDGDRVRGLLIGQYLGGQALTEIFDGPLRSAMHRLGELWRHDDDGVFIEHRGTDLCLAAVNHLRQMLPARASDAPLALGGAPSGDPYLLPSLLAATALADLGFREVNLGPQTPAEVIIAAARAQRPRLVWLSVSALDEPAQRRRQIESLAQELAAVPAPLCLGGRAIELGEALRHPNLHCLHSMTALCGFARGLLAG